MNNNILGLIIPPHCSTCNYCLGQTEQEQDRFCVAIPKCFSACILFIVFEYL